LTPGEADADNWGILLADDPARAPEVGVRSTP
jgi:hypothetical protein